MNEFFGDSEMQAVVEANKLRAELRAARELADGFLNRLCEAKALLREVQDRHEHDCAVRVFRRSNKYLPATHPGWKHTPACTCVSGRIEAFLKKFEH